MMQIFCAAPLVEPISGIPYRLRARLRGALHEGGMMALTLDHSRIELSQLAIDNLSRAKALEKQYFRTVLPRLLRGDDSSFVRVDEEIGSKLIRHYYISGLVIVIWRFENGLKIYNVIFAECPEPQPPQPPQPPGRPCRQVPAIEREWSSVVYSTRWINADDLYVGNGRISAMRTTILFSVTAAFAHEPAILPILPMRTEWFGNDGSFLLAVSSALVDRDVLDTPVSREGGFTPMIRIRAGRLDFGQRIFDLTGAFLGGSLPDRRSEDFNLDERWIQAAGRVQEDLGYADLVNLRFEISRDAFRPSRLALPRPGPASCWLADLIGALPRERMLWHAAPISGGDPTPRPFAMCNDPVSASVPSVRESDPVSGLLRSGAVCVSPFDVSAIWQRHPEHVLMMEAPSMKALRLAVVLADLGAVVSHGSWRYPMKSGRCAVGRSPHVDTKWCESRHSTASRADMSGSSAAKVFAWLSARSGGKVIEVRRAADRRPAPAWSGYAGNALAGADDALNGDHPFTAGLSVSMLKRVRRPGSVRKIEEGASVPPAAVTGLAFDHGCRHHLAGLPGSVEVPVPFLQ